MKRVVNTVLNCHRWQLVINNQERRFAKFQEVSSYQTSPISYTQRSLFSSRRHLNMVVASGRSWLALLVLVMATAPAALGAHNNRKMLDISLGGTSPSATSLFLDWGLGLRRALSGSDCDASASADADSFDDGFFGSAASRAAAQASAEASGFTGWPWRRFGSDCRARASASASSSTFGGGASFARASAEASAGVDGK